MPRRGRKPVKQEVLHSEEDEEQTPVRADKAARHNGSGEEDELPEITSRAAAKRMREDTVPTVPAPAGADRRKKHTATKQEVEENDPSRSQADDTEEEEEEAEITASVAKRYQQAKPKRQIEKSRRADEEEEQEEEEDGDSNDDDNSNSGTPTENEAPLDLTAAHERAPAPRPPSDEKRTRMVIRDIDVENFKSYYGQHRIGPFHKTFTAVIGPNGSGKSNVIDSMLFVFGRNAKKIRLEKLSELIHSSAAHPDVSYASVTVNFVRIFETDANAADPTFREEVPRSELRIKREVYRSGVSQYFIDGTRRTQKEVVERLIQEGIDLEHNRFLILQGEVEQIALMKPKAEKEGEEGLLEYLDDLIGTNEYIGRISSMSQAAEQAQLERLESLDKERKLRAERDALDDAKNSTMAFVTKDNHLQKTLIVMCQLRMMGIEEKLVEPRRMLGEIDVRIEAYEQDVQVRREAKARAEEEATRMKKEAAEATKERDGVRSKKQTAEAELEKIKSGADEQDRARKKVTDAMKKCRDDMQKAVLQHEDAEREFAIHQKNYEEATEAVKELQAEHEQLSTELLPKLKPLHQALEEKKKAFTPFEKTVTEATEQLRGATSRLQLMDAAREKRQQEVLRLRDTMADSGARVKEIDGLLHGAENNAEQHEKMIHLQDMIAEASRRKHSINNVIQEMKQTYRDGEACDRAMEFLLSQRSLKGYYGTLRQLGRIDDMYDIAAGVASNAWGFHVVEDRATATAALQLLKENNIGRATMMVVSEVEKEIGERMRATFTAPNPKCKRLFDLIQPTNAKFRGVFYQAVRDTLVVDTLTEAREVAFGRDQRRRVVTVKGELVEPSGTITGGGAAPRGAKLKAARSPQDKQAIKEEMQRLQQELVQAAEEERNLQLQLHQLSEKETRLTPEHTRKLRTERNKLAAQVDAYQQRMEVLQKETEEDRNATRSKERQSLVDAVEESEQQLEKAQKSRLAHHKEIEALETQIDEVGGAAFKTVADSLKKEQDRVEAEEAALRTCRRLIQKHRATQERKAADLTEHEKNLQRIEAEAKEGMKGQIADCIAVLEDLTRQLNGAEARLAKVQANADEARASVPAAHAALVNAMKKLEDEQRYRQTEQARIADALQELAKFEQKIDGCEEKIKENAELYGVETLQLDQEQEPQGEEEERQDHHSDDSADDDDDDDEEWEDEHRGDKRGRRSDGSRDGTKRNKKRQKHELSSEDIKRMSFKLSAEELQRCDYDRSVHLAKALSEETKRLHGEIDFRAVALWRERDLAHRQAMAVYMDRKETSDKLEMELSTLKETRRAAFMKVFSTIRRKLKEVYQLLTHGGDADMELVDANDPFEGIQFVVRPPKKSWKQISNLSGGEKTLSSLALIFSLHHVKPTPIYVMDEIDAALDFRNVSIVANYVLRQATDAQFIIISLRNNMFEMAHQLVGVCKVNDVTTTLVLMPRAFQHKMNQMLLGNTSASQGGGGGGSGDGAAAGTTEAEAHETLGDKDAQPHQQQQQQQRSCMRGSGAMSTTSTGDVVPEESRGSKKNVRFSDSMINKENVPGALTASQ